jgi:hypothetical protein
LESNFIKDPPFYKDKKRKIGIEAKPIPMMRLKTTASHSTKGMYLGWLSPRVWNPLQNPWLTWTATTITPAM